MVKTVSNGHRSQVDGEKMQSVVSSSGTRNGKKSQTRLTAHKLTGRWAVRLSAIVLLSGFSVLRVWDPVPVEAFRLKTFDLLQLIQPREASAKLSTIVDIDEKSLRELGQWPWPRDVLARLLRKVQGYGARVVAFDVLFAEPDRASPAAIADRFHDLPPDSAEALRRLPSNDRLLADAIRDGNVVLGRATAAVASPTDAAQRKSRSIALIGGDPRPYLFTYPAVLHNLPILEEVAAGHGLLTLGVERDNIVRRVPAVYRIGEEIYPSLVAEMLRVDAGQSPLVIRSNAAGVDSIIARNTRIPTDRRGQIWVHYAKSSQDQYVSATDVLHDRASSRDFAGRWVFIGTSAAGLFDLKATPLARSVPGVEVQAQLLETILSGSTLTRPNIALSVELCLLLATGALMIVFVPLLGAKWTLALGALIEIPLFGGAWYAYTAKGMLIDVAYPAFGALAIYFLLTAINYLRGESEKRRIRTAFSRYISPDLVARLAEAPDELSLGGEQKEMTLLFSDIHGFTGISEHYEAVALTNLVNAIFNPLTHAILDHDGTVDKYMGDSIMAFWNAPLDDPDHARHACLAALEMQRRIPILNRYLAAQAEASGLPFRPVKLGIGINTGDCCVGNMGSDLRFDYSVLGDTVNIAARLEGQTRPYKVHNIIGESTWRLVPDLASLELDLITVSGKTTPVRIYTLLGDERFAETSTFKALKNVHDQMLDSYRHQSWFAALELVKECRKIGHRIEFSALYDMYRDRITELREEAPGRDWNAVFKAKIKA